MSLRLVIFDVDGTLVDSQAEILAAMHAAFGGAGLACPPREEVLRIVGLSLPIAIARLAPELEEGAVAGLVEAYKAAFFEIRAAGAAAPLYPGARAALEALAARDDLLLGIATGKSARGLAAVLERHDLGHFFITRQVADHHPSKPHPAMVQAALSETGIAARNAVMFGDTSFDMEMGRAAGVGTLGAAWGYHGPAGLGAADTVIEGFGALEDALEGFWRHTQ